MKIAHPKSTIAPPARWWPVREAARCLHGGGIVAYPTEAVYGLGCDPADADAVARLLTLKGRDPAKGLILIAADVAALEPWIEPLGKALRKRVTATWPGPVTWLVPARHTAPSWLRGAHDTLAVRATAHPVAAALCRAFGGAVVSTSANRAGRPPARSALQVHRRFGNGVDYVLPGRAGPASRPTEIRDAASGRVVRAG